ncbi:unnamed protein product [Clavelina lepadiformis]|uniref:Sulfotransferase n=1 Tax=Clavelina lepadiformis TaxID=159417 RepID=A0ABP0FKJ9_CLALP
MASMHIKLRLLFPICFVLTIVWFYYAVSFPNQKNNGHTTYNNDLMTTRSTQESPEEDNKDNRPTSEIKQVSPGAVILLTHTRSGSSFVGEIFNQKRGVAYFYEPLFPFGTCPRTSSNLAEEYFPNALRLNFSSAWDSYIKGNKLSRRNEQEASCVNRGVCFASCTKCSLFLSRDSNICRNPKNGGHACPGKLNMIKLSEHVAKVDLMAFKVVYMCDISWIQPLLNDPTVNLKIIHLVRDPRAIINSRIFSTRSKQADQLIEQGCKHMTDLLDYADRHLIQSKNYMRVRHEDFALKPLEWTEKIYNFVGLQLDENIISWLKSATSQNNSSNLSKTSQFGTKRNSADTVSHWRKVLSWENVLLVQKHCTAMNRSGYFEFHDKSLLKNMTIPSFDPSMIPT